MPSSINLPAIIIANIMGITILFVVAVSNAWRFKKATGENKCLLIMFIAAIVNCVLDPIVFLADGKPGLFSRIVVFGGNSLIYLGGVVLSAAWIYLVAKRLRVRLSKVHSMLIHSFLTLIGLLLVINIFVPVVFTVDSANVYSRLDGYWAYNACYALFMLDGFILYYWQRSASGGLKFFPVWAFIIPAALGVLIQALIYGVSTAAPFATISVACVVLCLQNELMLRDRLTGLYNRFYLGVVEKRVKRKSNSHYSAIMLDINAFKQINDTFGHNVGDDALIKMAQILSETVGKLGEVVRYAGDEFIIIVNSHDDAQIRGIVDNIHVALDKFNNSDKSPYKMSVSAGYCKIDLKENTLENYMDKVDELMYGDKQKYYKTLIHCSKPNVESNTNDETCQGAKEN